MKKIFELDQHIANLIAAGEVVERPASVVKELVENSIDAGATAITVEIQAGGMSFIRVTDNGSGMSPEDAATAFLRHATSKLRAANELEAIGTLGFRGEALAAIAAVSRIELLTREQASNEGVSLSLEAGNIIESSPAGCPEGTTIIVRDLFFNTPARQKFMKTDRSESAAVATVVLRCALSSPHVSIRFIKDGKSEYHTPGDGRVDSTIYSLLGREFMQGLIEASSNDETIAVTGYVSAPTFPRGNRSYQFFIVNGRPISSRTLQAALEQAFANNLPSGRFPSCVLYINIAFHQVDVNVHPAKTEVKFASDKQVFDGVYYAALSAISNYKSTGNNQMGFSEGEKRDTTTSLGRSGGFRSMDADAYRKTYSTQTVAGENEQLSVQESSLFKQSSNTFPVDTNTYEAFIKPITYEDITKDDEIHIQNFELNQNAPAYRVIGEALNTYIILECFDGIRLIDKHAAHERIHFDALRNTAYEPMPQSLITPIICRQGHEEASILMENVDLLEKLGFFVESFGEDAIAVRQIPTQIEYTDAEAVLSDICTRLTLGETPTLVQLDEVYKAIACKAAIKAGKSSHMEELSQLAARVMSGEVTKCPHGRPVMMEISKATLDRGFLRL
ncbi:MAG: DNA mismatch repair endonuclease MutL [Oscillospiraceae bacterium]|nr:DNA mismatch repair endonuclease MutL [Oscillospiraceae bacterium]